MDRIVVGVNGSPASTAAALWAAGEAAMRDIELTIVHVLATPPEPCSRMEWPTTPLPSEATNAVVAQGVDVVDHTLDAVARRIGRQPPRITSQLCFGPVVPTLWEFTQQGAQMIALGRHSRGNILRARMSSVTNEMLQTARCPVAVVPQNADSRVRARRAPVVVGIDRQPACQLAIAVAFDEAARRSAELEFRTKVDHIYAVGDVIGFPALAATSMEQGRLAAYHAFGEPAPGMPELQPIGIYSIPEVSYVGATEVELTRDSIAYEVGVSRYRELARGQIAGASHGMLKLLVSTDDRRLLGVHIFGTDATELVHIGQAVMGCGGTIEHLVDAVFNYPTFAEAYRVAALDVMNKMRTLSRFRA